MSEQEGKHSAAEIISWIIDYVSVLLARAHSTVSCSQTFDQLGLDLLTVVVMTEDLGDWLGRAIEPARVHDYPTIEKFAAYLSATERTTI